MDDEKDPKDEPKEEVELDEEAAKAISKQVASILQPAIEKNVSATVEKSLETVIAKLEGSKKKNLKDATDDEKAEDGASDDDESKDPLDSESKELRLIRALKAQRDGDTATFQKYQRHAMNLRRKAGYANEADNEDGGYLVPDPEFDTTVYDNLPKYGVAFQFADVRQTNRNAVRVISLDSGLSFTATAEAGVKTSAKLQFNQKTVDLVKYAVIVPATDELTDDAAIDFWNLVTRELSRAYSKKADEVTFTDSTMGITNTSGVITEPVSGAGSTITWDDLLSAEGNVEDDVDTSNYKWFMRKETWYRLIGLKGSANDHYLTGSLTTGWVPNPNQPTTPWGTPVVFTRVLPRSGGVTSDVVGSNDAFAVYGDLANYILYSKRGMALKMLTEATVVDSEGSNFNLATQDGTAMRAVVRMLGVLTHGNAPKFVVLGTGTVS